MLTRSSSVEAHPAWLLGWCDPSHFQLEKTGDPGRMPRPMPLPKGEAMGGLDEAVQQLVEVQKQQTLGVMVNQTIRNA